LRTNDIVFDLKGDRVPGAQVEFLTNCDRNGGLMFLCHSTFSVHRSHGRQTTSRLSPLSQNPFRSGDLTFGNGDDHESAHAPWPLDAPIRDPAKAGLTAASLVRMKLFTLDHRLIIRKTGTLSTEDRQAALSSLRKLFDL